MLFRRVFPRHGKVCQGDLETHILISEIGPGHGESRHLATLAGIDGGQAAPEGHKQPVAPSTLVNVLGGRYSRVPTTGPTMLSTC